jgi:hypothetical protein
VQDDQHGVHFVLTDERMCMDSPAQQRKTHLCIPRKGLRGISPNFLSHVSVSDLYIPTIGLTFLLQENMWTDPGNI